jgi:hypothetical protein
LDDKGCREGVAKFPWENNEQLIRAMDEKNDSEVFYQIGISALTKHQSNLPFLRLIFYSALEEHELAERFFGDFIERIYDFIGDYIRTRQADGAFRELEPRVAVRAFMGMLIHHSLNNLLWDKPRRLLNISNEEAAKGFAEILLRGIAK